MDFAPPRAPTTPLVPSPEVHSPPLIPVGAPAPASAPAPTPFAAPVIAPTPSPASASSGPVQLHPEACFSCARAEVPCEVRTEATHKSRAACRRCHRAKQRCTLSGPRRVKPAPDSAPSASGTHPALSPSARFVYSFDSTSSAATSAVSAPTTVAAAVAEVASSSSSAASGSRPIAPLPSRPIPPPSTQATPSAPLPAPPNGASPYVEVLRRQLVAATAAKDAALAERDVALAENAVLLASAHAERASRQATLAATHATEARIAAAGEYIETSHRAFLKLFMEPRIQAEGEKVTLELMKSLWTAFAQSQHVVLEGKGEGRELEELLDEGAVLRAREILEEAMRGPQHLPGHEHAALYGTMQEGEQEDEEYEDDDSDAEVDQIDGDEEPLASSTSVPVHMTTILHDPPEVAMRDAHVLLAAKVEG